MEERLREALLAGEEIRWMGRPSPFKLMEYPYRSSFLGTWLLSAVALGLAVFYLVPLLTRMERSGTDLVVMLVVVAFLPAMLSLRPVLDKLCLERSTLYAITNYRAIALVKDDLMYIPISHKLNVAVEEEDQGCGNLCFGAAIGKGPRQSRSNAVLGIRESSSQNDMLGMLFYHVPNPERLLTYFA